MILAAAIAAGCGGAADGTGNKELGIARFDVAEHARSLTVRGLAADGSVVGAVELALGQITVPETELTGYGRTLTITVDGQPMRHASLGVAPMRMAIATRASDRTRAFLADPRVEGALARWDIALLDEPYPIAARPDGETAYYSCSFSGCASSSTQQCCMDNAEIEARVCTQNLSVLAERHCPGPGTCPGGGTYPNCTGTASCPANSSPCGNACCSDACNSQAIGGAGCALCWDLPNSDGRWNIDDYGSSCASAECGGSGDDCCDLEAQCNSGLACSSGSCVACGGTSEPCCAGSTCDNGDLACSSGTCVACGGEGQPCCAGACDSGDLACGGGNVCVECGGVGQPCCGDTCNEGMCAGGTCGLQGGSSCSSDEQCASGACSGGQCTCAGSVCTNNGECCENQSTPGVCDGVGYACLMP